MLMTGNLAPSPTRAALLGRDVVLAIVPAEAGAALPGRAPPYGSVLLHGGQGPLRLVAFRQPEPPPAPLLPPLRAFLGERSDTGLPLFDDAEPLPMLAEADELAPVSVDPLALAEGLEADSRVRLLDFLLSFCRAAFKLGQDAGFAGLCLKLATLCAAPRGAAVPVAEVLPGWLLYRGVRAEAGDTLYVLGRDRVRLSRAAAAAAPAPGDAAAGLQVAERAKPGDLILALGASARGWTVGEAAGPLPHVLALPNEARGFGAAARAACRAAFAGAPPGSPAAALLREVQVLHPARPVKHDDPALPIGGALELALPDGAGGIFLRGWLRDPLDLSAEAALVTPAGTRMLPPDALHRVARPDLAALLAKAPLKGMAKRPGFVAHVPGVGACLQPTLQVRLRSGARIDLVPPLRALPPAAARDAVLSAVAPGEAAGAVLRDCIAPAAEALHRLARAERGAERVHRFGVPVAEPSVAILVPLYRNLSFLRFQVAAFAADRDCRAAELVFALDSPEQEPEVRHLLRGLHHLHALPMTLVVMERNAGYSAATNAAARVARAPLLLLLNSDVVPHRPGWLRALNAGRVRAGAAAATAKLLFDDGSLQHAGLYFERDADGTWFNRHYHKGMPRRWAAADRGRFVPGGTGAALLVERARFEQAGGLCEDYVVGDYEDSDFCLRLQQAEGRVWYEPRAELFHFERRSIALHAGYQKTLACQFNRHLHHARWDDAMRALMAERRYRPPEQAARAPEVA